MNQDQKLNEAAGGFLSGIFNAAMNFRKRDVCMKHLAHAALSSLKILCAVGPR